MNAVTDQQILDRIIQSDIGKKVVADIDREATAQRISLKSQIATLKKERGEATAELNAAVKITASKLEQARQAMRHAEEQHMLAQRKLASVVAGYDARIAKAEGQVRSSAPQVIDDTLKWLNDQADEVRSMEVQRKGNRTGRFHTASGEAECDWYSTAQSQQDRITAIRQAIAQCQDLKMKVMDADELQSRLEDLRELPPVTMQFEGRK